MVETSNSPAISGQSLSPGGPVAAESSGAYNNNVGGGYDSTAGGPNIVTRGRGLDAPTGGTIGDPTRFQTGTEPAVSSFNTHNSVITGVHGPSSTQVMQVVAALLMLIFSLYLVSLARRQERRMLISKTPSFNGRLWTLTAAFIVPLLIFVYYRLAIVHTCMIDARLVTRSESVFWALLGCDFWNGLPVYSAFLVALSLVPAGIAMTEMLILTQVKVRTATGTRPAVVGAAIAAINFAASVSSLILFVVWIRDSIAPPGS